MKKSLFSVTLLSTSVFASPFAEVSSDNIIPAKDGFYGCYLYDEKDRFVSSVGWQRLFFDNQYFGQKSKKGLFEMGNNEIWQAIYQSKNAKVVFQRTSNAYRDEDNTEIFITKVSYTKGKNKPYIGSFTVYCGA